MLKMLALIAKTLSPVNRDVLAIGLSYPGLSTLMNILAMMTCMNFIDHRIISMHRV